jgi:hypothetical protein
MRVPATLVTGVAINQLFVKIDDSRGKFVPPLFVALMSISVCLEISVVFITTASVTRILGGGFDKMATNTMQFLIREFEFAYVATRLQFFLGLLCFCFGMALRAWTAFPRSIGSAAASAIAANALSLITFFNETCDSSRLLDYRIGMFGYALRFSQLALRRLVVTPVGCATLLATLATCSLIVKAIRETREQASMDPTGESGQVPVASASSYMQAVTSEAACRVDALSDGGSTDDASTEQA